MAETRRLIEILQSTYSNNFADLQQKVSSSQTIDAYREIIVRVGALVREADLGDRSQLVDRLRDVEAWALGRFEKLIAEPERIRGSLDALSAIITYLKEQDVELQGSIVDQPEEKKQA